MFHHLLKPGLPHTQGIFKLKKISGKFLVTQGTFFDSKSGNPVTNNITENNEYQNLFVVLYSIPW